MNAGTQPPAPPQGAIVFHYAGACDRPPAAGLEPVTSTSWSLAVTQVAGLRIRVGQWNSRWQPCRKDELLLIPPGITVWNDEGQLRGRLRSYYALFDVAAHVDLARFLPTAQAPIARFGDPGGLGRDQLKRMSDLARAKHDRGHYAAELRLLRELLNLLFAGTRIAPGHYRLPAADTNRPADPVVERAAAYVASHLQQPLSREAIARHAGQCVSGLAQRLKRASGESIMGMVRRMRIEQAAHVLATGATVQQAADAVGFSDLSILSRIFKRLTGLPPATYARQAQTTHREGRRPEPAAAASQLPHTSGTQNPIATPPAIPLYFETAQRDQLDATVELVQRFWTLDYFYTPGVRVRIGQRRARWLDCPAGTAHLYAPGTVLWEDGTHADKPIRGAWIFFHPPSTANLQRLVRPGHGLARFTDDEGKLARCFAAMQRVVQQGPFAARHQDRLLKPLADAIDLLLAALPGDSGHYRIAAPPPGAGDSLTERVSRYLSTHFTEPVDRARLAREFGVSISTLSHTYRRQTGEGPMEALSRLRLARAKELLAAGASVKEVAAAVGYRNEHYFSRAFRKAEGLPPRNYRRLLTDRSTPR